MAKRKTRKSGSRQPEAITMLIQDHQKVQKLFKQFEKTEGAEERSKIVEEACADLTVHTQLEEQVFYPAVRRALEEADLLDEAEVEHDVAKDLIEKLKGMRSENGEYSATFVVLSEYVSHHIEEEQNELFPAARKTDLDFNALAEEMHQRKKELREELGLEPEAAAQPRAGRASRKAASSRHATR
jgi:hemerythrin-like domain-containing protein